MERPKQWLTLVGLLGLAIATIGGCDDRDAVQVYQAPKEPAMPESIDTAMSSNPSTQTPANTAMAGEPVWVLPPGWTRLPDQQMRFATFAVDPADPKLNVVVYNFGPESNQLLGNVNRWEQQIGAPISQAADLPKVVSHLKSNGLEIDMVDIAAPAAPPQVEGTRMLAAIIPTANQVWFLKFVGPASKIAEHQAEYEGFLKSISFPGSADRVATVAPPSQPASNTSNSAIAAFKSYVTPDGWTLDSQQRPMRVATFSIADGAQKAELIITALPANAFGSPEANINRWRGQVGLAPITDAKTVERTAINVGGGEGVLFDFTGAEQRLIVAQVASGHSTYFFKLIGPSKMIESQKPSFDSFLKSVQFVAE